MSQSDKKSRSGSDATTSSVKIVEIIQLKYL